MSVPELTAADIGEFGLIARLKERFASQGIGIVRGIGDDTAALQVTPGCLLLATTDAAVEGVHFRTATTTPAALGRRALAVNLSDIASMGGVPRWALISLALPLATPLTFVEGLADGLAEEAALYQTEIVGGNLARSLDHISIDITLLGEVAPAQALYRTGARPGDRILATGTLGDSAAGLAILLDQAAPTVPGADYLISRHRLPTPRMAAGRTIAQSQLATAMIDLSDGLASDLGHLAEASRVGAVIAAGRVPLSPELRLLAQSLGRDPLTWALRGGEDYELLLTAPPDHVPALTSAIQSQGVLVTDIGEITAEPGLWLVSPDGQRAPLGDVLWRHFELPQRPQ